MNLEMFNEKCTSELERRLRIKRQRGLAWGESDDKRFMGWFSETARLAGISPEAVNNKFFLFMISHSTS